MNATYQTPAVNAVIADILIEQASKLLAEAMLRRHTAAVECGSVNCDLAFDVFVKNEFTQQFDIVKNTIFEANEILKR